MDKEQVLEVKKLIEQGYGLKRISTEFEIPIEELERYKREIEAKQDFRRRLNNTIGHKNDVVDIILDAEKKEREIVYNKISDMKKRYDSIFPHEKSKEQQEKDSDALSMEEMTDMLEKMEKLLKIKNDKNAVTITKILSMYMDKLERTIKQITDIEELRKLNIQISLELDKMNPIKANRLKTAIQSRISKLQHQAAIDKIKNDVSAELEKVIVGLANGKFNIARANKIIDSEVTKRRKKAPANQFGLTEENQREQVLARIYRSLAESRNQVEIINPEKTMGMLMQLNGASSEKSLESIVNNLLTRKEYAEAKTFINSQSNQRNANQIYILQRKVQAAELGEIAVKMLTSEEKLQELKKYYDLLENGMRKNGIKVSQIAIGKINNGTVTIYLDRIWDDQKQR